MAVDDLIRHNWRRPDAATKAAPGTGPGRAAPPPAPGGPNRWTKLRAGLQSLWVHACRRPLVAGILAVVVLGALGYALFGDQANGTGGLATATVTRGNIEDTVTALGSLQPSKYVDVGAQVSGQLKKLYVDVGDHVKQGDLLAEIDTPVAAAKVDADRAQLKNLEAQLLDKQSTLALNQANADRQTRLEAANATAQADYDAAIAALKSSQAQIASLKAQITQAQSSLTADEATLSYAKIYAPMAGTIASITAKEGQTLNANQIAPVILQIADLSVMTVQTQVSEADVSKLHVGMDAYFTTLGSANKRWYGKLQQIWPTPTVVNNVVLYTALFNVDNPNGQLMTQMTAQVFFITASANNVLTVPLAAVHYLRGGTAGFTGGAARRANGGNFPGGGSRQRGANGGAGGPAADAQAQSSQGAPGQSASSPNAGAPRGRPATVTLIDADSRTETRMVRVGVTDRVNAEILSGLKEGDKVVVGTRETETARPNNQQRPNGFARRFIGTP